MDEQEQFSAPVEPEPAGFEPTPKARRMRVRRLDRKRSPAAKSETLWRKKSRHLKRLPGTRIGRPGR